MYSITVYFWINTRHTHDYTVHYLSIIYQFELTVPFKENSSGNTSFFFYWEIACCLWLSCEAVRLYAGLKTYGEIVIIKNFSVYQIVILKNCLLFHEGWWKYNGGEEWWAMRSIVDRGPQRTEFSRAQNRGEGGIEAKPTLPWCQGRGVHFWGDLFLHFALEKPDIFGHFRIFQVLILTFWNVLFKLESPKFPPPLPSSFKPCGPQVMCSQNSHRKW